MPRNRAGNQRTTVTVTAGTVDCSLPQSHKAICRSLPAQPTKLYATTPVIDGCQQSLIPLHKLQQLHEQRDVTRGHDETRGVQINRLTTPPCRQRTEDRDTQRKYAGRRTLAADSTNKTCTQDMKQIGVNNIQAERLWATELVLSQLVSPASSYLKPAPISIHHSPSQLSPRHPHPSLSTNIALLPHNRRVSLSSRASRCTRLIRSALTYDVTIQECRLVDGDGVVLDPVVANHLNECQCQSGCCGRVCFRVPSVFRSIPSVPYPSVS